MAGSAREALSRVVRDNEALFRDVAYFKQDAENARQQLEKSAVVVREQTAAREKAVSDLREMSKRVAMSEAKLRNEKKAREEDVKAALKRGTEEGRQEGWLEGYTKGGDDFLASRRFTDRVANPLLPWIHFGMRVGSRQMVNRVNDPAVLSYVEPDYDDCCGEPEPIVPAAFSASG